MPITGINWWTVEIALTSYTLLTLFTNTLAGLNGVSADVRDAAAGIGLTKIADAVAGRAARSPFRPSSPASASPRSRRSRSRPIAAVIVPAGLGKPIFDALGSLSFNTAFVAAGTLAVLLALPRTRCS